jgi:CBS domain containing-hemolysin-like protein
MWVGKSGKRNRSHWQDTGMVCDRSTLTTCSPLRSALRVIVGLVVVVLAAPQEAHASFLSPELEDKLATFLALFVIFVVPVVLIVLFWLVHILPEKIAHKRHHPQFEAIRTLCLLSLVFGGLLWPLAWLWAYSKPVMYKMAYGTDKHPDSEKEHAHARSEPAAAEIPLRERIARLEGRGIPEAELRALHADLDVIEAKFAAQEVVR